MVVDAAHKSWWQIGEVVFGAPLVVAIVLQLFAPISSINPNFRSVFIVVGVSLCAAGATLITATRHVFSKYSQPTDPGLPTSSLMTTGTFSVSRNPMYLGAGCLTIGIALVFSLIWVVVFIIPTFVACHLLLIKPEERYLATKFGSEYQSYSNSVSRWAGRRGS